MNDVLKDVERLSEDPLGKKILTDLFIKDHNHVTNYDDYCKLIVLAKHKYNTANLRRDANRIRKKKIVGTGECEICGFGHTRVLHMHHILPFKLGGNNDDDNLSIVCPNCHKLLHATYQDIMSGDMDSFGRLLLDVRAYQGDMMYQRFVGIINRFLSNFKGEEDE